MTILKMCYGVVLLNNNVKNIIGEKNNHFSFNL